MWIISRVIREYLGESVIRFDVFLCSVCQGNNGLDLMPVPSALVEGKFLFVAMVTQHCFLYFCDLFSKNIKLEKKMTKTESNETKMFFIPFRHKTDSNSSYRGLSCYQHFFLHFELFNICRLINTTNWWNHPTEWLFSSDLANQSNCSDLVKIVSRLFFRSASSLK